MSGVALILFKALSPAMPSKPVWSANRICSIVGSANLGEVRRHRFKIFDFDLRRLYERLVRLCAQSLLDVTLPLLAPLEDI